MIRVRETNEERKEFGRRAREYGYRSLSEFIRSPISDEPEHTKSDVIT